MFDSNKEC